MNLTSLIPWPYRIAALVLLAAAMLGAGFVWGLRIGDSRLDAYIQKNDAAVLAQVQKAAQKSANLLSDAQTLEEVKNAQIQAISGRLAAALGELRQRPERRADVPNASAACQGSSGAELSGPDAEFLAGEAARADRLRAALDQCYRQYDAASQAVKP